MPAARLGDLFHIYSLGVFTKYEQYNLMIIKITQGTSNPVFKPKLNP